jgi:hypothetical protein
MELETCEIVKRRENAVCFKGSVAQELAGVKSVISRNLFLLRIYVVIVVLNFFLSGANFKSAEKIYISIEVHFFVLNWYQILFLLLINVIFCACPHHACPRLCTSVPCSVHFP